MQAERMCADSCSLGVLFQPPATDPRGTSCLGHHVLQLASEFGITVFMAVVSAVVAVDVVDVELGVLGPLGVGLEEPMIVFHIALAQGDSLPDKSCEAATRSATCRVCLGPDSFPAGEGSDTLPSSEKTSVPSMLLDQQNMALGQESLSKFSFRCTNIDRKDPDVVFPSKLTVWPAGRVSSTRLPRQRGRALGR